VEKAIKIPVTFIKRFGGLAFSIGDGVKEVKKSKRGRKPKKRAPGRPKWVSNEFLGVFQFDILTQLCFDIGNSTYRIKF